MNKISAYFYRRYCTPGRIKVDLKPKPSSNEDPSRDANKNLGGGPCSTYLGQPSPFTHSHLLKSDETTLGVRKDEYAERRHKLMYEIKKQNEKHGLISNTNLVVLPAASTSFYAPDVPYPFRQESNFFYLSGYQEPNSFLVIQDEGGSCKSTLFVSPKDPHKELWEGPRAGLEGAQFLTGVDSTGFIDDIKSYLSQFCSKFDDYNLKIYYDSKFVNNYQHLSELSKNLFEPHKILHSPYKLIHELRWRKSMAEINLMRKAAEIASKAFVETMKFSYPGVDENILIGKFDYESRLLGSRCLAYPPVVAGGNRANTIHYLNADQLIHENELVLMDAGCEFGGYVSDITRNWPVNGKFSPAQSELYDILLDVQTSLIKFAAENRPITLRDLFFRMLELLKDRLVELGLVPSNVDKKQKLSLVDDFCPHHVSHYLGLDVHDTETVSKTAILQPGVVITIEPGLYFKSDDSSIPERFRGIGLRIEDDVLITETGVEVLSALCPKNRYEIEQLVSSSRSPKNL